MPPIKTFRSIATATADNVDFADDKEEEQDYKMSQQPKVDL